MKEAQNITEALYHGSIADLSEHELEQAFGKMPTVDVTNEDKDVVNWLIDANIYKSKRQAREDITNGAVTINGVKVTSVDENRQNPIRTRTGNSSSSAKGKKEIYPGPGSAVKIRLKLFKKRILTEIFSICYK